MKTNLKEHWPLYAAIIVLMATLTTLLFISVRQDGGHFIYAQDDAYIHMNIAKNFAQYGVWGVTRHEFSSSASSLLWVLILSFLDLIVGSRMITPLILNILFATLTLWAIYFILRREKIPSAYAFIVLLAIIFLTPLPNVIFTGMEHVLQTFITIIFVYTATKAIAIESPKPTEPYFLISLGVSPLVTMIRYEGLFLISIVCLVFLWRRRLLCSLLIGGAALVPLLIYSLVSISHGWFWLPNSVLLKGHEPQWTNILSLIHFFLIRFSSLADAEHVILPVIILTIIFSFRFWQEKDFWDASQLMIVVFVWTAFCHLFFASIGSFCRYEAYLMVLGIFIISLTAFELLESRPKIVDLKIFDFIKYGMLASLIVITITYLSIRGIYFIKMAPVGSHNIYEQQYQMSRFLHQYYEGKTVVVNDIGMVNYFNDLQCLDIWGLSNIDIAKMKKSHTFSRAEVTKLFSSKNIQVAIVYDCWSKDVKPSYWKLVGEWKIVENFVCKSGTVLFYAPDAEAATRLVADLRQFAPKLPKSVIQSGLYTEVWAAHQ